MLKGGIPMANLSSFSMLNQKVQKYKDDNSLDTAGIAFGWLALETILNLNSDEIEDAITDGYFDGSIDAVHIIERDVHIFNFKYTEQFKNAKNNFPSSEIGGMLITLDGIYNRTIKKEEVNGALWDKITAIWELFDEGTLNFKYHLCSNKEKLVDVERVRFEDHLKQYKLVDFYYYDLEDMISKIIENKFKKVDGKVTFIEKQYFERSDGPLKGIVATITATDLINLVKDPDNPNKVNGDAFNENVRVYMKLKNRINQNIYETALSDSNYEFWYLNNGINILCEECDYIPNTRSPAVTLKNLQIVNGGQTTHALFEAYHKDSEKVDDVLVIVRICQTTKSYMSEKISETTNSQTPVRTRDLRANDRIQKKLEEEFLTLGYYYERKKNQHASQPKLSRLDSELLAQLYLAYYLDKASEAKNQKRIVFAESYDEIFDETEITASKMLLPYKIYLPLERMKRDIQKKKRSKEVISEKDAFISRATLHILNAVKIIADYEKIDLNDPSMIDPTIEKATSFIEEKVGEVSAKRGESYTHDKFFKWKTTNKLIQDHVRGKYKSMAVD